MAWKVPYINYPQQYEKTRTELLELIDSTLSAGDVMLRHQLHDFEANLAAFVGTQHAVGMGNCTDALHLSLLAAGVGPGDEVITVSHTMVATASAIHHSGADLSLVDIGDDHNMDMDALEKAITPRTKAVMPVHLNGRVCDMGRLMALADKHGFAVIEDAAQALGGSFNGINAGSFGLAGCFSFYPAKLLGTYGDGGAVTTNDSDMLYRLELLRNHGRTEDNDVAFWSFNSRLDNLHAAILDFKLKLLPEWIDRRRAVAQQYHSILSGLSQLLLPPPPVKEGPYYDVFQNYEIEAESRDELAKHLNEQGIETMLPWGGKAVHQFKGLGLGRFTDTLPRTELAFSRMLMIPMHCELSDDQVEYVGHTIRNFYGS